MGRLGVHGDREVALFDELDCASTCGCRIPEGGSDIAKAEARKASHLLNYYQSDPPLARIRDWRSFAFRSTSPIQELAENLDLLYKEG